MNGSADPRWTAAQFAALITMASAMADGIRSARRACVGLARIADDGTPAGSAAAAYIRGLVAKATTGAP